MSKKLKDMTSLDLYAARRAARAEGDGERVSAINVELNRRRSPEELAELRATRESADEPISEIRQAQNKHLSNAAIDNLISRRRNRGEPFTELLEEKQQRADEMLSQIEEADDPYGLLGDD